jgi:hypothetical protein
MTMDCPTEARSATASIFELAGCSGLELSLECRIEGTEGRFYAHGTSTCLVVRRKP